MTNNQQTRRQYRRPHAHRKPRQRRTEYFTPRGRIALRIEGHPDDVQNALCALRSSLPIDFEIMRESPPARNTRPGRTFGMDRVYFRLRFRD
jgi:hypothetical protein